MTRICREYNIIARNQTGTQVIPQGIKRKRGLWYAAPGILSMPARSGMTFDLGRLQLAPTRVVSCHDDNKSEGVKHHEDSKYPEMAQLHAPV